MHALLDPRSRVMVWRSRSRGRIDEATGAFDSSLGPGDGLFMAEPSMDYDGLRDPGDAIVAAESVKWAPGLVDGDVTPGNSKMDPKQQVAVPLRLRAGAALSKHSAFFHFAVTQPARMFH